MKYLFCRFPGISTKAGCGTLLFRGVLFILILGIAGALFQSVSAARDRKLYPPPGQLVDVGGYRLHLYCIGDGSLTVILEAGSGGKGVIAWSLVQDELANLSTDSTHIVVENGAHHLQFFQPEVVIDAVEKMIDMVRSQQ